MTAAPGPAPSWADEYARELNARPSLFERRGVHAMRACALAWVRANPAAASALPGWNAALLDSIIRADAERARARVLARAAELVPSAEPTR